MAAIVVWGLGVEVVAYMLLSKNKSPSQVALSGLPGLICYASYTFMIARINETVCTPPRKGKAQPLDRAYYLFILFLAILILIICVWLFFSLP